MRRIARTESPVGRNAVQVVPNAARSACARPSNCQDGSTVFDAVTSSSSRMTGK
jgi:hypothetical protein